MIHSIKTKSRVRANTVNSRAEPIGRSMKPAEMLEELERQLTSLLGPFKTNPVFKTLPSKMTVHVKAGKILKGQSFYRLMEEMDFTATRTPITGMYGGFRLELDGTKTIVGYCSFSGVLVVSTNSDVIVV